MKDSLFTEETLKKIQKIRKIFLKFAVWILIAELIFWAVLILTGGWGDVVISRTQGTFLVLALILLVSVNNFIRMEKGNRTIQTFALIGFISNLIWGIFAFMLMWEIVPFFWTEEVMRYSGYSGRSYSSTEYHMTFYAIAMFISSYSAIASFFISNVMSIKETIKLVKPLKITAVVCLVYLWIFGTIMTPIEPEFKDVEKLYQLAVLAGLAFEITALAALIISKTNKKKMIEPNVAADEGATQFVPKTDAELRAEIEEKVRREMIEKEVRAEMEAKKSVTDDSDVNDKETTDYE